MKLWGNLAAICVVLSGCATASIPRGEGLSAGIEATPAEFSVRPLSQVSPDLLHIKDPIALAVEARVKGDYLLAYQYFYAAWIASPESVDVVVSFADMAIKTGRMEKAYEAALSIPPKISLAYPRLIAAQVLSEIAVGKSDAQELQLNRALEYSPSDSRLWNALGRYYDSEGEPERAEGCYRKALLTGGSSAGVLNNLGMSLLMQGQLEAALSRFEQAVELQPGIMLYDNNRRLVLALDENYEAAIEGLTDNRRADILNDAGYIAKTRNDDVLAVSLFKAAINLSTSYHHRAHANLVSLGHTN